ncbi:DNA-binding protein SMUBP-2 [Paramormyrops kingsleyae]|uniref:DNA-binding protein SMUBP-2 n=1 Tax=Paramormyrops kingsleyae TaxID=1676925 RepID=UPI003B96DAEE
MEVESFVSKSLELLREEREAELAETRSLQENASLKDLQRKGVCLLKLHVASERTSLYGRLLVVFEPRKHVASSTLPSNSFSPGDIVGVYDTAGISAASQLGTGVVTRVTQSAVSVAFDESHDGLGLDGEALYNLLKLANDVTYKRLKNALTALNNYRAGVASSLINLFFGSSQPGTPLQSSDVEFFNPDLDESQREAVSFALSQREVAIIHGPPGTGKTTTVVEIILQAVRRGLKVLCCAPSNVAVDNLLERLVGGKARVLRLGHPARLLEAAHKHSLEAALAHGDGASIVADIRSDIDKALAKMKRVRDKGERSQLRAEVRELRRELAGREEAAMRQTLKGADVMLATNTGASDDGPLKVLPAEHFDLLVIDECGQALEGSCWIPLLRARRCVLAGDHQQLPPVVKSPAAASKGLGLSLMERLIQALGGGVVRMLTVQYRMNAGIMRWASEQMYQGRLSAHGSVEGHLLRDLAGVSSAEETDTPLFLIDTAGCGLCEMEAADEQSRGNEGEADVVAMHVEALTKAGVKARDIAVIAPYNLQVELLRQRLSQKHPELEIKSVDGFQGREKEAVVLSLVRSNRKGEVGFLAEDRRINVAVTRARRHLAVVCDSQTVRHHAFLRSLVDYLAEHGEVRTAFEYLEHAVPQNYSRDQETGRNKEARTQGKKRETERRKVSEKRSPAVDRPPASCTGSDRVSHPTLEGQTKIREEELKEQLLGFMEDPERSRLDFPASLSARDRLLVHQIAEELGLSHKSAGTGRERRITVTRATHKEKEEEEEEAPAEVTPPEPPQADPEEHLQEETRAAIQVDLKTLHLERMKREQAKREEKAKQRKDPEVAAQSKTCKKAKHANKGKSSIKTVVPPDEDDFDALIDAVVKAESVCGFGKCKAGVQTLGQLCPFCNRLYCLSHHIPEVHGCGGQAKAETRRRISREGVLYAGSGPKDKSMEPSKKAYLQRKLDSKLKDLANQRKTKPREKEQ